MEAPKTYLVLDTISPRLRNILSFLLILTGFLFQISARNILIGLPFIIACLVFNTIKSISIKKESASELTWQEVTPAKIDQVLSQCQKIKKFKSIGPGCFIGLIFGAIFSFIFFVPWFKSIPFPLAVTIIDSIILFSGLFLSGNKSAWMPGNLNIKTEIVKRALNSPIIKKDPALKAIPYLEIGKTKAGSFPNDARILIKLIDAPEEFIGVQGQISINTVKSTNYPYFYTVIIAKPEFNLLKKFGDPGLKNITIESKKTSEVDVIVIRQTTTKTSGYHTNDSVQDYILTNSINLAKSVLSK